MVCADANSFLREPAEHLGAVGHFAPCFCKGLAHLRGHDGREPVSVGNDELKGAPQNVGPFARRGPCPCGLGAAGGFDGQGCVFGPAVSHVGDDFIRGRVLDWEGS